MLSVFVRGLVPRTTLNSRMHWAARARAVKAQREHVTLALHAAKRPALPVAVTLTRCAPHLLDDDNAVAAMKALRDAVARWLGVDDRDERVSWRVEQQKAKRGAAGTRIEIAAGGG